MSNRTICLINDSFPPVTDGVANAVVNYGRAITESGDKAVVVTACLSRRGRQRLQLPGRALSQHRHDEACRLSCGLSVFREDHADTYGIPV